MQLDPATIVKTAETAQTPLAEGPGETAPIADIFAALLSALTPPAAPVTSAVQAAVAGDAEGEAETPSDPPSSGAPTFGTAVGPEVATTLVVADRGEPAGLLEVPRDARGLPLAPSADPGAPVADPQPPVEARPIRPGTPTPLLEQTEVEPGTKLPRPTPTHVRPPAVTPTNHEPEGASLDGRPVPPAPVLDLTAARKPAPVPVPEPAGEITPKTVARPGPNATPVNEPDTGATAVVPEPDTEATAPPAATAVATATVAEAGPAPTALTAHPTGPIAGPRPADPPPIQAQVLRQLFGRINDPGSRPQQITLQLEPEHLGKVEVRLTTSGDKLQVEFQAESAEAGMALREGRQELVRTLSAQGGRWQQIDVRVAEPEGSAANRDDQDEERSEPGSRRERDQHQRRRRRGER